AAAGAQHERLRAGQVVRHAEARTHDQFRPDVGGVGNAVAGLTDTVVQVAGIGNDGANRRGRVRRAWRRQDLTGARIHGIAPVAALAKPKPVSSALLVSLPKLT